jgi:hypothetical protein
MTTKSRLHHLVDELSESEVAAAERYLEYLRLVGRDPVLHALLTAPEDDEPETDTERAAVAEGAEDLHHGRAHTLDEVRRELGL